MTEPRLVAARIGRDAVRASFDICPPALEIGSGERAVVETVDARWGAMAAHSIGSIVDLDPRPPGQNNPVTGPLGVTGAMPGGAVVVHIERIACHSPAWTGAHARPYPAGPGRVPRSRARICSIEQDDVLFGDSIRLPVRPMIGTIGTTPVRSKLVGDVGRHGGNLDHPTVGEGARILLPVFVRDALLYLGDVHARQGDGELSALGLEVAADVTIRVDVRNDLRLRWPWLETDDVLAVLTCGRTFDQARRHAVVEMMTLLEDRLALEPAEALALVSATGDLRIGQAVGGRPMTLRLEIPRALGLGLDASAGP